MSKRTTNDASSQPGERPGASAIPDPFPRLGVETPDGEYGDESVDVTVRRYIDVDVNLSAGQSLRLTADAARKLAAALLSAADDLDGTAREIAWQDGYDKGWGDGGDAVITEVRCQDVNEKV